MTNNAGGGGFEGRSAGVVGELGVSLKAATRAEDSGDGSSRQQVDAAQLGQR